MLKAKNNYYKEWIKGNYKNRINLKKNECMKNNKD